MTAANVTPLHAFSPMQRALIECLQDGTVVVMSGGVVCKGDLWTDKTIRSLVARSVLVSDSRHDVGTRRAFRLAPRYITA